MAIARRTFLGLSLGMMPSLAGVSCGDAQPEEGWHRGPLAHLLPSASSTGFVLKLSTLEPLAHPPRLRVADREVEGSLQDTAGRFWAFRVGGLAPGTEYRLELRYGDGPMCESWPLSTLPARDARPERLRVASFTCAGGPQIPTPPSLFHVYKPVAWRHALFDWMLAESPDVVIANGDHVYFDLPQMAEIRDSLVGSIVLPFIEGMAARFDPALAVLGSANEAALTTVGDDQIASVYGVRFRSTPVYFITDDHDYFVNDDATPGGTTLPPSRFHAALRSALQRLYLPELPADDLPADLPGREAPSAFAVSTHFGEVRYGDLFSALVYDCGGHLSLGEGAGLVPPAVERWLVRRTRSEDTIHLVHAPSHPVGWTAGKWREWYPDHLESTGSMVAPVDLDEDGNKFMWQPGWWRQHQALMAALAAQQRRAALVVSGDLHALGAVRIERSGALDLRRNPVHAVLSGPVGTGDVGWPSRARGVSSRIASDLVAETLLDLDERNGFTLLDFDRRSARIRTFGAPAEYFSPRSLRVASALEIELARG